MTRRAAQLRLGALGVEAPGAGEYLGVDVAGLYKPERNRYCVVYAGIAR